MMSSFLVWPCPFNLEESSFRIVESSIELSTHQFTQRETMSLDLALEQIVRRKPNGSSTRSTSELIQDPFLNDIVPTPKKIRSIIFYLDYNYYF